MSVRGLVVLLLVLAVLGAAWHKRDELQAWAGSAKSAAVASLDAKPAGPAVGAGALRKCVNGQQVSYSNVECPTGSKELAVSGAVTVLPGTPVAKPSDGPSSAPAALRKALDVEHHGENMTDKAIERAINGGR